ncbi:MAG: AbfB domain-containing protein [Saprospiraceae bacterium]|nr:AbfB domain-containing protein [Saprospiraceae bacterium]
MISGLTVGYWYKVSGEYKGGKNVHLHYKDRTKNAFSVDIDGVSILVLALPKELETWTKFEAVFRATKTSCTLRLRGEIDGTDGDVMLDNIKMEETKAPAEVAPVKLPDYFKLHAYSIHGKRVDKGSDYWMGHTGADLSGKIIAPKAGTVFHIEKVVLDAAKGIIALKVINAPESDMYLSVADDKSVKITKINGGSKHHFIIRSPEEKEAMNLNYVTFESEAFPGWNLRHQGFALKVTQANDDVRKDIVYRQDATWLFEAVVNN